ncbi:unnamed protein product [Moneuplotes crassus]|uniref:Uncharacterized protein n=1 Tax=Euplotes crassus TaxID=5936 RepID=A0AAD1X7R6_EUPCR|nr:unnamed protein product [Moneuplotes crassus]
MGGGSSNAKKKKASKETRMITVVSKKVPDSKITYSEMHSIGWERPESALVPDVIERPSTTINESENIARITPMLEMLELHNDQDLDQDYVLEIWGKYFGDKEFIREVKQYRFPKIKQLRLRWLSGFKGDKEIKDISDFFKSSVKVLDKGICIHGGSGHFDLSQVKKGFNSLLPCVQGEIYLDTLYCNEEMVQLIFEKSFRVRRIVFCNCKIDISESFSLSHVPMYKLQSLDLYCSCAEDNSDYLDYIKLPILAKAMSNTNIVNTLEHLHVRESWYSSKEVSKIFKVENGFNVEINGYHRFPEELE